MLIKRLYPRRWSFIGIFLGILFPCICWGELICKYQSDEDIRQIHRALSDRRAELSAPTGVVEQIVGQTGCPKAIDEQLQLELNRIDSLRAAAKFPLDQETCANISRRVDIAESWMAQYQQARGERKVGRVTPDVCKGAKLSVAYTNPCKEAQPVRILQSEQVDAISSVEEAVQSLPENKKVESAQEKKSNTNKRQFTPRVSTELKDAGQLTNSEKKALLENKSKNKPTQSRKFLAGVQKKRVLDAEKVLAGKMSERPDLMKDLGELLIRSELLEADSSQDARKRDLEFLDFWQEQVEEYRGLYQSLERLPFQDRLDRVLEQVNQDFTKKYNGGGTMRWNSPETRMTNFLLGDGANCQGNTKFLISMATAIAGGDLPKGQVFAVQMFSDHVEPVIYDSKTDQVLSLKGGPPEQIKAGAIFHPAILLNMDLDHYFQGPIDGGKLQIRAEKLTAELPKAILEKSSDLTKNIGKGEIFTSLPKIQGSSRERGDGAGNSPRYGIEEFSSRVRGVFGTGSTGSEESQEKKAGFFEAFFKKEIPNPQNFQNWKAELAEPGFKNKKTSISSDRVPVAEYILTFASGSDLEKYKAAKSEESRVDLLISLKSEDIKKSLETMNSPEMKSILNDPTRWMQAEENRKLMDALRNLAGDIGYLGFLKSYASEKQSKRIEKYEKNIIPQTLAFQEFSKTLEKTVQLVRSRPESVIQAVREERHHESEGVLDLARLLEALSGTPPILSEFRDALLNHGRIRKDFPEKEVDKKINSSHPVKVVSALGRNGELRQDFVNDENTRQSVGSGSSQQNMAKRNFHYLQRSQKEELLKEEQLLVKHRTVIDLLTVMTTFNPQNMLTDGQFEKISKWIQNSEKLQKSVRLWLEALGPYLRAELAFNLTKSRGARSALLKIFREVACSLGESKRGLKEYRAFQHLCNPNATFEQLLLPYEFSPSQKDFDEHDKWYEKNRVLFAKQIDEAERMADEARSRFEREVSLSNDY